MRNQNLRSPYTVHSKSTDSEWFGLEATFKDHLVQCPWQVHMSSAKSTPRLWVSGLFNRSCQMFPHHTSPFKKFSRGVSVFPLSKIGGKNTFPFLYSTIFLDVPVSSPCHLLARIWCFSFPPPLWSDSAEGGRNCAQQLQRILWEWSRGFSTQIVTMLDFWVFLFVVVTEIFLQY